MSDNQKYYYMRIKESFFDTNEMVVLESMQDGYLYSNILLKLYLRSLKDNGKLMFNDRIPYNAQMIATITRHSVGTVEKALRIFQDMGLIEVLDNGAIYMLDIQQYIGKSSTEGERKRLYRQRINSNKKELMDKCPDKRPPEIDIDIELEKEIDTEIKTDKEKKETYVSIIDDYTSSDELKMALKDFVKMRQQIKGFTHRALRLALNKLDEIALDDYTKIDVVNQSVMNGWKSFYPLHTKQERKENRAF